MDGTSALCLESADSCHCNQEVLLSWQIYCDKELYVKYWEVYAKYTSGNFTLYFFLTCASKKSQEILKNLNKTLEKQLEKINFQKKRKM